MAEKGHGAPDRPNLATRNEEVHGVGGVVGRRMGRVAMPASTSKVGGVAETAAWLPRGRQWEGPFTPRMPSC